MSCDSSSCWLALTIITATAMAASSVDAIPCLIPGYTFFKGQTSKGNKVAGFESFKHRLGAAASACSQLGASCKGFTTYGSIHTPQLQMSPIADSDPNGSDWQGLYIKNNGSSSPKSFACIIPGYTFYPSQDSPNNTIRNEQSATPGKLADLCNDGVPGCVGFNTIGDLKNDLQPTKQWVTGPSSEPSAWDGLYVKGIDVPGYKFYPGLTSTNTTIWQPTKNITGMKLAGLADQCTQGRKKIGDSRRECIAFDTNGYLTWQLRPQDAWISVPEAEGVPKYRQGMYTRVASTDLPGYQFYPMKFLSSEEKSLPGVDTTNLGLLPEQLADLCSNNADCRAFDTTGVMKASQLQPPLNISDKSEVKAKQFWQGMYVKPPAPPPPAPPNPPPAPPPPSPPPPPTIVVAANIIAAAAAAGKKSSYEANQQQLDPRSHAIPHVTSSSYYEDQQGSDSSSNTPQASSSYYEDQQGDASSSNTPQASSSYYEDQQGEDDSSSYSPHTSSSYEEDQQGGDSSSYSPHTSSSYEEDQQGGDSSSYSPHTSSSYEEDQQGGDSRSYTPHTSSSYYEDQQGGDSRSYTPHASSSYYEDDQGDDISSYAPHTSSSYEEDQKGDGSSSYSPHQPSSYSYEDQQGGDSSSYTPQASSSYYEDQQGGDSSSYSPHTSSSYYEDQQGGDDSSSYTPHQSSSTSYYEDPQGEDGSNGLSKQHSSFEDGLGARGDEDTSAPHKQSYQLEGSQDSYLPVRESYGVEDYEDDDRRRRLKLADGHSSRKLKL